ncbi:methylaspartate mutase [Streptomyces tateyamensis]|uniref:Methylaspartate mutase n=1 Tax=Streptomyces tateyamensis TaxID=565073 RepID=A0A2V4PDQ1_9ACTN|nr:cobalamin-dependent protein [Streptomyces tateyamensis]PYC83179.1 methylaspartate mutase [Streptomyces tateyamensis]
MNTPAGPADRLVILGVAESDAHAVANQLITMQLQSHGFTVLNLGVCTPLSDFADAHDRHPHAEAVLIGSLNGHAHQDLRTLPELRAAGRLRCPVIVGGNLSVGSRKAGTDRQRLLDLGVDHLLADAGGLVLLLDMLHAARAAELQHG